MARVELDNVSKVFPPGVRAVDGVSLSVGEGEFVVLVGPSGCGKSTALRLVAGLDEPTAGAIRIGDRLVNGVAPRDRDIAMVFQHYALYPHMSVRENMEFGLKLRGVARAERRRRVMETSAALGLEPLLERKPKALSGGQRQRVALGRAIVREPAAFLLDEPLSNLDARLRISTRAEIKRLHQRLGTTTLYVTHDQEEAMTLGDRLVVMKDGKILQASGPLATYNSPINRFVAGFIGMPPMNFFAGLLESAGDGLLFQETGATIDVGADRALLTPPARGFTLPIIKRGRSVVGRLSSYVGRPVVLGVRPEHLRIGTAAQQDDRPRVRVAMDVTVVEPLGNDMDVYLRTSLHDPVIARVSARSGPRAGETVQVGFDLDAVHLFEPGETGMNLTLETALPPTESSHALI